MSEMNQVLGVFGAGALVGSFLLWVDAIRRNDEAKDRLARAAALSLNKCAQCSGRLRRVK